MNNLFISEMHRTMQVLAEQLDLEHLNLDEHGSCKFRYLNCFDVEFIANPIGTIQMHAYLIPTQAIEDIEKLSLVLLQWNMTNRNMAGTYLGISDPDKIISLNITAEIEAVETGYLKNLLNNFIATAIKIQDQLYIEINKMKGLKNDYDGERGKTKLGFDEFIQMNSEGGLA